LSYRRKSLAH